MRVLRLSSRLPLAARTRGAPILTLNEHALDAAQLRAVSAPLDAPLVIRGAAGSGKTRAMLERLRRCVGTLANGERAWITTPVLSGVAVLRAQLNGLAIDPRVVCLAPSDFALELVRQAHPEATIADDIYAAVAFERAAAELVDEDWLQTGDVDPEVSGIRSPQRFRAQAFRLFRKLRSNGIAPEAFEVACRRGLTEFYAHPPNFTSTKLIMNTQAQYRDSLFVDPAELDRQRAREADLIKVLTALYRRYVDAVAGAGITIESETILRATSLLREGRVAAPLAAVFVDDAHDLSVVELALIEAAGGRAVTFAGDPEQATRTFSGRATRVLNDPAAIDLTAHYRAATLAKYRPPTQALEALRLAEDVRAALEAGTPARNIAVLARGLRGIEPYLEALVSRGIQVDIGGCLDLFSFSAIEDVLAALWAVADPYRHDWTMRNLEAPWLALNDQTIALLCGEPPDAQALLFELPDEVETSPSRRASGRGRMLRFGRNFLRGDADAALNETARARLSAFRAARDRWQTLERSADLPHLVHTVAGDSVLACATRDARGNFERRLIDALVDHARRFCALEPFASLHDYLLYIEAACEIEDELEYMQPSDRDAVAVYDIETAKGREFSDVFVVNVRAGAFPRWYVPDAFIYYPSLGIVAKENVGEGARAARTAKFTYAMSQHATRDKFCQEERRALHSAIGRATSRVTVLGWGTPTRGASAPELLSEL